jgi:trimethylamine--corrinoid protein Co-methyltransferase
LFFENAISGTNLINFLGYLDFAMTGTLEMVLFCNEIIRCLRYYFSKMELNQKTLALDLIHEMDPD